MCNNNAYYHGIKRGYITTFVRNHFELPCNGKVKITIKKKGPYKFVTNSFDYKYEVHKNSEYIGMVCCKPFKRLFFTPKRRKTYDIIVERLE